MCWTEALPSLAVVADVTKVSTRQSVSSVEKVVVIRQLPDVSLISGLYWISRVGYDGVVLISGLYWI